VEFSLEKGSLWLGEASGLSASWGSARFKSIFDNWQHWIWKYGESLEFSVKLAYGILRGEIEGESSCMFNSFWRIKALHSTHVITWRVLENMIASKVNLARREIVVNFIFYSFCGLKEEFSNYLFFGSRISWLVWNLCFSWLGLLN